MTASVAVRILWPLCHSPNPMQVPQKLAFTVRPRLQVLNPLVCPEPPSFTRLLLGHSTSPTTPHKSVATISTVRLALVEICSAAHRGLPGDRRIVLKSWTQLSTLCRLLQNLPKSNRFQWWMCTSLSVSVEHDGAFVACEVTMKHNEVFIVSEVTMKHNRALVVSGVTMELLLSVKSQWSFCC